MLNDATGIPSHGDTEYGKFFRIKGPVFSNTHRGRTYRSKRI